MWLNAGLISFEQYGTIRNMTLCAKVLVIGGGPAGAIAARFLAAHETEVILLERNPSFVKPCGGGVSLSAFEEIGIPKNTIKKELSSIMLISPRGERVKIALQDGGTLAIVERGEFDRALRVEAAAKGAKIVEGEFMSVTRERLYRVEVESGETQYDIASEYIIAADGVNSKVRTAVGIKPCRSFFTASGYVQGENAESCEFWFGSSHAPGSYSWVFPANEGISIGTASREQRSINGLFEKFRERKGIGSVGTKRIYRIPIWDGKLYNKEKILFAGDAAGQVLPLTYEGIYYAMKAAEFAAEAVRAGKVDTYRKMWQERFQKRFTLMDKLRNYFLKDDTSAERLVALHRRPDIQEASMRLWLSKDRSTGSLMKYVRLFGKFLR
jgi:geranylgeranyl reductase